MFLRRGPVKLKISIHAPREGGDQTAKDTNSTADISIHAPREGGDTPTSFPDRAINISIHAPREGGDYTPEKEYKA